MRVLMLSIDNSITEPGSVSFARMAEIAQKVEALDIVVLKKGEKNFIEDGNLKIFSSPHDNKFQTYFWAKKLCREKCEAENYDVITSQDPFHLGDLALSLGQEFGIGAELQLHGDFFSNEYWRKEKPINKILFNRGIRNLKKADVVRAVSKRIKDDLVSRGIEASKITVVPVFVDWQAMKNFEPDFSLKEKYPQFDFIALSLGRLEWVKNIDYLIKVWAEHVKKFEKDGLIVVGDGSQKESLIKLVRELGIEESVVFEPPTPNTVNFFKGADAFILTSRYEGWGRTVVESLACGCPVIMTDVGCAGEVVRDGENGIIFPVGDKTALIEAIQEMRNPEIRNIFKEAGPKYLKDLPGAEETIDLYINSWKKAIKR